MFLFADEIAQAIASVKKNELEGWFKLCGKFDE